MALALMNLAVLFLNNAKPLVTIFAVLLCALLFAFCYFAAKFLSKIKTWQIIFLLYIASLALKLFAVFFIAPEDFSDFWTFRMGAAGIARGDVSFVTRLPYYSIWAYQFGFEWLMSPFFKLFGQSSSQFALIINSFFAAGSTPLLFCIGRHFLSEKNAAFSALVFTLLPISINLSGVFTNQHLSLFFILLAILLALQLKPPFGGAAAGLCLCIAKIARPDEIVYIAAVIVSILLLKRSRESFISLACMLAVYFVGFKVAQLLVSPLQPFGLGNNYPLYKFAVGLNEASFGAYSGEVSLATFENEAFIADHALRDEQTLQMIKDDLSIGPVRLIRLFAYKTGIQWGGIWHQYEILHDMEANGGITVFGSNLSAYVLQKIFEQWDCISRIILFIAASAGGFFTARKKEIHMGLSVFLLAFMAFSAVAMLIEVQYRYSLFVYPALCFAAVIPLERIENGEPPANIVIPRGAGEVPSVPSINEKYGVNSACIAETGLIMGIGRFAGMDIIEMEEVTGGVDTNLDNIRDTIIDQVKNSDHDFFLINIDGADEAGHDGNAKEKVAFIEKVDKVVMSELLKLEDVYIFLTADHSTPVSVLNHSGDPVPILINGPEVRVDDVKEYNEYAVAKGGLCRIRGADVMNIMIDLMGYAHKFGA